MVCFRCTIRTTPTAMSRSHAAAGRRVPRTTAEVDCRGAGAARAQNGNGPNDFSPDDAVAVATVEAPLTTTGVGGCQDGSITFTVTLAPR